MHKKELRGLKRISATEEMCDVAKNNRAHMTYANKNHPGHGWKMSQDTKYDLMASCQAMGKILMVCIFFPEKVEKGELTPTYEIYCDMEGEKYITRILEKGKEIKWSGAMADNLGEMTLRGWTNGYYRTHYEGFSDRCWESREGKSAIKRLLKTESSGILGLIEWQRKTHNKKNKEREERELALWDADMKLAPRLPLSFLNWLHKECPDERYIFYNRTPGGADTGYCSHCRKEVKIFRPKRNAKGKCPSCKADIQYKVASKIQTLCTGIYEGQIIQRVKGGIMVRTFRGRQRYKNRDCKSPYLFAEETERILMLEGRVTKRYYFGLYKNKTPRWILDKRYIPHAPYASYMPLQPKLYRGNLGGLKNGPLKKSAIGLWENPPGGVAQYLAVENSNPAVEQLARVGMFRLAKELARDNWKRELMASLLDMEATELTKRLKIDGARLKRLKSINGGIESLKWYQLEKMTDRVFPDGLIKDFGNNGLCLSDFGFLPPPLSPVKIHNYLKKQSEISGKSMPELKVTWEDYLNMAQKARLDVKSEMIYKPKDLAEAHTKAIMTLQEEEMEKQAEKLEKKWPKVNGQLPKLKKFEYSDGRFAIVSPQSILDIVKEGTALRHCVHTCDFYFDRIQRDETYLFFLRRAQDMDMPWYTLEVEPSGNIRQKRTTGDSQNKDFEEALAFLRKWQENFRKLMTEEERELGWKADRARRREYAKLREDGNKVWHGKLAGKLLADVLENDFMAADANFMAEDRDRSKNNVEATHTA